MNRGKGRGRGGMGAAAYPPLSDSLRYVERIRQSRALALRAQRFAQVPRGALGRIDVHLHAGAELEAGADGEPGNDVDVPAELIGSVRGRANPQVQLRRRVEQLGEGEDGPPDHRRADLAVRLEGRRRAARDDAELEGRAR